MKQFLKDNPFDGGDRNVSAVVDYLAVCYLEDNPISSTQIKAIEGEMEPYYEGIPFAASERLFSLVYGLCSAYQEAAFREGLKVGLHLQNEI